MEKPRCLKIFEESIKSAETKKAYTYAIEKFRKWSTVENYEELLQADEKSIQRMLEDYIMYLKGKISPNTINTQLAPVFLFYQVNDININIIRLKKMFPARIKRSGYNAYSREDIKKMLYNTKSKRTRSCILILSSTGCRSGALIELKMKDMKNYKNGCKIITFYSDDPAEYYGFLTPEASKAIDDYIEQRIQDHERITSDSPLIRENYQLGSIPPRKITRQMLESMIEVTQKDGQRKKGSSGRYNIPINHGFRKYFNYTLKMHKDANLSFCEKLMGHSTTIPLDNHYLPALEKDLFDEFLKAFPELTISDSEKQEIEIAQQKKKITTLEARDKKIAQLEARFDSVERLLERVSKSSK